MNAIASAGVAKPLANTARLKRPTEFAQVFQHKRAVRGVFMSIHFAPSGAQLPHSRLGLVVAKRYAKRAVTRNTVKRVLRAQYQHIDLPAIDIVCRLHRPLPAVSLCALRQLLHQDMQALWPQLLAQTASSAS